jgi:exopolysaccharide biosynthesis WecB/TagA/CpsF family protein
MSLPPLVLAGVPIQRMGREESYQKVVEILEGGGSARVAWMYAHCVLVALKNPEYREALNTFEFVLNDGAGIEIAGYIQGRPVVENLCGTDWIPDFLLYLRERLGPRKIFLLGSRQEVVSRAGHLLEERVGHHPVGFQDGYDPRCEELALEKIRILRPEVLLVTLGVPRQELFLYRHWDALREMGVRLGIAGGAVLDFWTGFLPRAPRWLRAMRGEWVFRLLLEPGRLGARYLLGNPRFLFYALKEGLRQRFTGDSWGKEKNAIT